MNSIDEAISYTWTLGWGEQLSKWKPIVNRLLKAIIEENVAEIDALLAEGASLKACDSITLRRVLYHVADNYPVMARLVANGVSRIGNDIDTIGNNGINDVKCLTPSGYRWGLTARAYYLKAYDVMDLLAANGFDDFACYDNGWDETWEADDHILRTGDEKGLKILLENGYVFSCSPFYRSQYEKYVLNRTQVKRKTAGLDPLKFKNAAPQLSYEEEPLLFGRKEAKARNARRREDYEDRVRALKEFRDAFGAGNMQAYLRKQEEFNKVFLEASQAVLRKGNL